MSERQPDDEGNKMKISKGIQSYYLRQIVQEFKDKDITVHFIKEVLTPGTRIICLSSC